MLKEILGLALLALICGCGDSRKEKADNFRDEIQNLISIGDDIFEAKEKLVDSGFSIVYGPDFQTKDRSCLLMIIDYGLQPTSLENLNYVTDLWEDDGELISGIVRADPSGRIFEIE